MIILFCQNINYYTNKVAVFQNVKGGIKVILQEGKKVCNISNEENMCDPYLTLE